MKWIFILGFLFCLRPMDAQIARGDRILGWQVDMAENNSYDSAIAYTQAACLQNLHLAFSWSSLEPDTAQYNSTLIHNLLDIANIYYPYYGIKVELQISPINTNRLEVPSSLTSVAFDAEVMIRRFTLLLDTVFAHIPQLELTALNLGNESDIYFGNDSLAYTRYTTFLNSVSMHAKNRYFQLHGDTLKTGTTFTFKGLTQTPTSTYCKWVNQNRDIISVTYYPQNTDFSMQLPQGVHADFSTLCQYYSDVPQPIYFVECGYASSPSCNSSEVQQKDFYHEMFAAWDNQFNKIKYVSIFKSTDWSAAYTDTLCAYYGIANLGFKEFLRSLGVRTWPGNGTSKPAYTALQCELQSRNWCNVHCAESAIDESKMEGIFISPNPIYTESTLQITGIQGFPCTLSIYSLMGVLLIEQKTASNTTEIHLGNKLSPGMYVLKVQASGAKERLLKLIVFKK